MYLCVHACAYYSALPFPQAKQGRSELLQHPLVTSLLDQKWNKLGAWCYFTNLLVYVAFVFFLTMFALAVRNPLSDSCKHPVCIMKYAVACIYAWIQELGVCMPIHDRRRFTSCDIRQITHHKIPEAIRITACRLKLPVLCVCVLHVYVHVCDVSL